MRSSQAIQRKIEELEREIRLEEALTNGGSMRKEREDPHLQHKRNTVERLKQQLSWKEPTVARKTTTRSVRAMAERNTLMANYMDALADSIRLKKRILALGGTGVRSGLRLLSPEHNRQSSIRRKLHAQAVKRSELIQQRKGTAK